MVEPRRDVDESLHNRKRSPVNSDPDKTGLGQPHRRPPAASGGRRRSVINVVAFLDTSWCQVRGASHYLGSVLGGWRAIFRILSTPSDTCCEAARRIPGEIST